MKIYTRTGDKGQTGIIGGRVNKDDLRVEAYGTVDELNGFVALAHAELDKGLNQDIANDLIKIQHELFDLGGDLASVVEKRPRSEERRVGKELSNRKIMNNYRE